MPNWCVNKLSASGPATDIDDLHRFMSTSTTGLFNALIPYPDEFKKKDEEAERLRKEVDEGKRSHEDLIGFKDGFNSGGYEWCVAHWGTKWDVYSGEDGVVNVKLTPRSAAYQFDTAWGPPLGFYDALSRKFPKLKFTIRYYEGGNGYKGILTLKNGETLKDEQSEYFGHLGG